MTVKELSRDQLSELKQRYLDDKIQQEEGRTPYMGELANADELVSDEAVFAAYEGVVFSCDDFVCTAGQEAPGYRRICVQRSGYAVVPGNTDEEALAYAAEHLSENDFDWEPVNLYMIQQTAKVVDECGPCGESLEEK